VEGRNKNKAAARGRKKATQATGLNTVSLIAFQALCDGITINNQLIAYKK
jgi:hypothetical protein